MFQNVRSCCDLLALTTTQPSSQGPGEIGREHFLFAGALFDSDQPTFLLCVKNEKKKQNQLTSIATTIYVTAVFFFLNKP